MWRLLEYLYLSGLPLAVIAVAASFLKRKLRFVLLSTSVLLVAAWAGSSSMLRKRAALISESWAHNSSELLALLGTPDNVHSFPEGDVEWAYAVRVWPYEVVRYYWIFQDQVLASTSSERVGLIYDFTPHLRSHTADSATIHHLELQRNAKQPNQSPQTTPGT